MNIIEIIEKRINLQTLEDEEINFVINNYVANKISDAQMAAFLTTTMFRELTTHELHTFTLAMMRSGDFIEIKKNSSCPLIDKHSTGGIGDKVSLILVPLLVSLGFNIVKLSGKSLGKTGGTLDKLSSIPNMKLNLSLEEMQAIYTKCGAFIGEQTNNIVPADKKIYDLRNQTGTVNSLSLLASSILAKKFILNTDFILIELTYGKGAFCKDRGTALKLAVIMNKLANLFHKKLEINLVNMNAPLGNYIGNALEVYETYQYLNHNLEQDNNLHDLISFLVTKVLKTHYQKIPKGMHQKIIDQKITNKTALNIFRSWINAQGGDFKWVENLENQITNIIHKAEIAAHKTGYFTYANCGALGWAAQKLAYIDGNFDKWGGIKLHINPNDYVKKGDPLMTLYSNLMPINEEIKNLVNSSFLISSQTSNNNTIEENISSNAIDRVIE